MADALTSKHCVPCEGGIPALTPAEIAPLFLFLASDQAQFITGALVMIDGGYTAQ